MHFPPDRRAPAERRRPCKSGLSGRPAEMLILAAKDHRPVMFADIAAALPQPCVAVEVNKIIKYATWAVELFNSAFARHNTKRDA
jgi:hypothetical protein